VLPITRPDDALRALALLADIRGDRRSADVIRGALEPSADVNPYITQTLEQVRSGRGWVTVETAMTELPRDLRRLLEMDIVSLDELASLHQQLGIVTLADIAAAIEDGTPGAPASPDVLARLAGALPQLRESKTSQPIGRAMTAADHVAAAAARHPDVVWTTPVGSLRRGAELVGDVEIVIATHDPRTTVNALAQMPEVEAIRHRSAWRLHASVGGVDVDLRCLAPERAQAALLWLTGSREHLAQLGTYARPLGLDLRPQGLTVRTTGELLAIGEADAYHALDLAFVPPELREGRGEVRLAAGGELAPLIEQRTIRGDLHMHTAWSDGRDSVEQMVAACAALGYEYVAITDHSPSSGATRNLSLDAVERQAEEIARVRERHPKITVLHGCEVDILANGRLDFPDRVLRRFDIVLASLHDAAGHSPTELLHRYLLAMQNPFVTVVTHPSNRLFPRRAGYALDYPKLFAAAAETRTCLEIDGAPTHLDLNAELAREAAAAGVMLTIDSDAHRTEALELHMRLGVVTARRAWIEPRHVLNARPWPQVKGLIAAKRRGIAV
jgi:DNA polymerase (family 10)